MKATIQRKVFADALSIAASASSLRSSSPYFESIRIVARDGRLELTGCDQEMWGMSTAEGIVEEPGEICVKQRLLTDIVGSLPEGPVELELSQTQLFLRQGQSEWKMLVLPAEQFPDIPEITDSSQLTMPMSELRESVDSVAFAVADDPGRAHLTGVLFRYDGAELTMVATDTHRLAVKRIHRDGIGSNVNAIVPAKALKTIKALPIAEDAPVHLRFDDRFLVVDIGTAKVVAQLLNGTYPNWERVVPQEFTRMWTIDRTDLYENVKRALIMARDNAYRVRFKGEGDRVVISSKSDDKGEAIQEIPAISKNGEVEIAFNGRYVMEALQSMPGEGIVAEMTEPSRPAVLRPLEGGDDRFCVVMPMALS